jgi:ketopantoate reductase
MNAVPPIRGAHAIETCHFGADDLSSRAALLGPGRTSTPGTTALAHRMLPAPIFAVAFAPAPSATRPPLVDRVRPAVMVDEETLRVLREENGRLQQRMQQLRQTSAPAAGKTAPALGNPAVISMEAEVNPLAAVFAGGGALGIAFAAFLTSSGSPPTGLAVAAAAILFMAAGGTLVESSAPEAVPTPVVQTPAPPAPPTASEQQLVQLLEAQSATGQTTAALGKVKAEVSPLAVVFAGGGALGIAFAAFLTSSGSPPTGLAVAAAAILFMAAGGALVESNAPVAVPTGVQTKPATQTAAEQQLVQLLQSTAAAGQTTAALGKVEAEVSPLAAIFAGGGALGIAFAAYCTSSGDPPTGLAVAAAAILFMAAGGAFLDYVEA